MPHFLYTICKCNGKTGKKGEMKYRREEIRGKREGKEE
jgi:hypothetical protein